jgi:hypothetical protein
MSQIKLSNGIHSIRERISFKIGRVDQIISRWGKDARRFNKIRGRKVLSGA